MEFDFSVAHYKFIQNELDVDRETINRMNEDELDSFYEMVLGIELAETPSSSGEMSQRGETAVEIVNIIAEALGYVQDDWDDDE